MGCGSSAPAARQQKEKSIASLNKTIKELKNRIRALESLHGGEKSQLAIVAKQAEPEPVPCICDASATERAKFLSEEWIPYVQELKTEYISSATRFISGYSSEQILPDQRRVEELAKRCALLTEKWHGQRNYSTMYEWLMEVHEVDRHSYPYRFFELTVEHSDDGWVRIVDGKERRSRYVRASNDRNDGQSVLPQDTGDSPIDNTILGNVLTAQEGHMLLAGGIVKQVFLKTVASKQTAILNKFSQFFAEQGIGMEKESWSNLLQASPEDVKDALEHGEWRPDVDLTAMGMSDESVAWNFLKRNGFVIESFQQLSKAEREQVQRFLQAEFMPAMDDKGDDNVDQPASELDEFVTWAKRHPGQWWRASKKEHEKLLVLAMLSPKYAVLKRSAVESLTHHRFFVIPWTRRVPLVTVDEDGGERVLREAGAREHSRIRKNKYPYADSHGLALSSGGLVERADLDGGGADGNLMFELAMPVDPSARLANVWLSDVEKLLHETALLNASRPLRDRLLPCEVCHEAGQNPAASSSIAATQHVQLARSSVQDWPIMQLTSKPEHTPDLDATLDLVQVGERPDALLLRFETRTAVNEALIRGLQDMRLAMMREFGGHRIDFNVLAMPDTAAGSFVVTFAPVAAMQEDDEGLYNAMTMQRVCDTALPRSGFSAVDSTQGKGNGLLYSREDWARAKGAEGGRRLLEGMYDFNAVPGARRILRSFLLKRYGYIDNVYGKAKGSASVEHAHTFKSPIFGRELGEKVAEHRDSMQRASQAWEGGGDEEGDGVDETSEMVPASRQLTEAEPKQTTPPTSPAVMRRWSGPRDGIGFGAYHGPPKKHGVVSGGAPGGSR